MKLSTRWIGHLTIDGLASIVLALAGCGGSGDAAAPPPAEGSATVAAAGGTVAGPDGVKLVIPADAVDSATTFRIARDSTGAPPMGGLQLLSPVYSVTPHGKPFGASALISIPFDASQRRWTGAPVLIRAQAGGKVWQVLPSRFDGNNVVAADTPGLSFYAIGECTVTPGAVGFCPAASQLTLTVEDGSGVAIPVQRDASGNALPVLTVTQPATFNATLRWQRPAGTNRVDTIDVEMNGLNRLTYPWLPDVQSVNSNDYLLPFQISIDPATTYGATAPNGRVVRVSAAAWYTFDTLVVGCGICSASWEHVAEVAIRVIYAGVHPTLTQLPTNQAVNEGQPATFSVGATGPNLSYQWRRACPASGSPGAIAGATSASYTAPSTTVAADDGCGYSVRVCTTSGNPARTDCVDSPTATLSVSLAPVAPSFTLHPASIAVVEGQTASFTTTATGRPTPEIAWYTLYDLGDGTLRPIAVSPSICPPTTGVGPSTTSTCTVGPLALSASGTTYVARARNSAAPSAVSSNGAVLTVNPRPVAPTITSTGELSDRSISVAGTASWTVTASGTAPISYSWYQLRGGAKLLGTFSCPNDLGMSPLVTPGGNTLTLSQVPLACNGMQIGVDVTNGAGAASPPARVATLTVTPVPSAPLITIPLSNRSALENTTVSFGVTATGYPALGFAWTLDGVPIPGCGGPVCSFTALLSDTGKTVRVVVANGIAPDAQSTAVLTVTTNDVAAAITQQPQPQSVVEPATATFSAAAIGTPAPTYQWEFSDDGGNSWSTVPGATAASYTTPGTVVAQSGRRFRVIVSNATNTPSGRVTNTVPSNSATLTVVPNVPPNALIARAIAAGYRSSLAIAPDDTLWAWGEGVDAATGQYNALGSPAAPWATRPVQVQGVTDVAAVALARVSGYGSYYALHRDGTVSAWGDNLYGQLGDQTVSDRTAAVKVLDGTAPLDKACAISAAPGGLLVIRSGEADGSCGVGKAKQLWVAGVVAGGAFGGNPIPGTSSASNGAYIRQVSFPSPTGVPMPVRAVAAMDAYQASVGVLIFLEDGRVFAWGSNQSNMLGAGSGTPVIMGSQPSDVTSFWGDVQQVEIGNTFSIGRRVNGTLVAVGRNQEGELGDGTPTTTIDRSTLGPVSVLANVSTISAGSNTALALNNSEIWGWGDGYAFITGSVGAVTTPTRVGTGTGFTQVSIGNEHALALGPGGVVYAWGLRSNGALGDGTTGGAPVSSPGVVFH